MMLGDLKEKLQQQEVNSDKKWLLGKIEEILIWKIGLCAEDLQIWTINLIIMLEADIL